MKKQNNLTKPTQSKEKAKGKYHNFDGHWKEMIQEFIQEFIEYFLPELYPNVDFNYAPEFLDTELQNILESIGTNKRVLDKLVKVRLKNGQYKWLLIHIEVQSYFEKLFAERMFLMYAMIFAKFRQKILGIAIYTNKKIPKQFDKYEDKGFGSEAFYKFVAYKVIEQNEEDLLKSDNIFALFVLANLYVSKTSKQDPKRLAMKEKLFELAMERNIDLDKISRLLIFVDGIMQLSKDLQEEYKSFVSQQLKFNETMVATSPNAELITEYFDKLKKQVNRLAQKEVEEATRLAQKEVEEATRLAKQEAEEATRLAKQEAEEATRLAKQEAEQYIKKVEQRIEHERTLLIQTLYFEKSWTIDQIADLLKLEKIAVQSVINEHSHNQ